MIALEESQEMLHEKKAVSDALMTGVSADPDKLEEKKVAATFARQKDSQSAVSAYYADLESLDERCCAFIDSQHPLAGDVEKKQVGG